MTYHLIQLASGAYDLLLHDTIVASVVRNGSRQPYTWTAELDLLQFSGERFSSYPASLSNCTGLT
jgi:hypothetical protein